MVPTARPRVPGERAEYGVTFATFATWIVAGVVVAWGAGAVLKYGGRGRTADVLLGLSGSGAAYLTAWSLGMIPEPGIVATAIVACTGAGTAIALQRKFFYVPLAKVHTPD